MSIALDPAVVKRFEAFYTHYCPQDLPILHVVLSSYHGREDALLEKLKGKYGPWPVEGVPEIIPSRPPSVASKPPSARGSAVGTPRSPPGAPSMKSPALSVPRQESQLKVSQPPSRLPSAVSAGNASARESAPPADAPSAPVSGRPGSVPPASVPPASAPGTPPLSRKGSAAASVGGASAASKPVSRLAFAERESAGGGSHPVTPLAQAAGTPPQSRPPSIYSQQPPRTPTVRESVPRVATPQQSVTQNAAPVMSRTPSMVSVQQTPSPQQASPAAAGMKDWQGITEGLQDELNMLRARLMQKERELEEANMRANAVQENTESRQVETARKELWEKNAIIERNEELLRIKERQIQDLLGRVDRQVEPVRSGPDEKTKQLLKAAYDELSSAKEAVRQKDAKIAELEKQLEEARAAILSATKTGYEHDIKLNQAKNALKTLAGCKKEKKEARAAKAKTAASPRADMTPYAVQNMTSAVLNATETPKHTGMDDEDDYEFEEEEVAEDDDDEDMGYYPEEAQPVSKKLEQECLTPDARRAAQAKVISDTVDLLALGEGAVRVLLRAYNWKYDRLQERYFEDAAGMRAKYGISCTSEPFKWAGDTTVECGVCYSESSETSAVAVSGCGHYFCLQCFGQYFAHQLSEKGMSSLSVTCPWNGCTFVCERKLVIAVLSRASLQAPYEGMNEALLKRYEMFHERSFVEDNPYVQWCPSPRCENCIRVSTVASDESLVVHCNCGMTFCFRCCEEDHMPATCEMLRVWLRKEQDESETANWIVANTKPCPGCGVNIEKNDGCNHITCQSCSYDFCWVCEQEWSKHGSNWYQCNFYEPTKDGEKGKRDTAKDELDRYIFYYTRYNNHDHSKHLEKKVIEQTKKRMALLQQDANADLHQVEYLQEAAEQLIRSREALKYTYVYAFNLKSGAEKSLFEFNQAQLEHSTETLSKMLEPRSKRQRQDVINQQALVRRSLERLQQGVFNAKKMSGRL